jgi:hypothetical protein
MYHTDDLLRKHHLLIDDGDDEGDAVRLVDATNHAPAHPDQALAYLGELAHGNAGFPGPELAAVLLAWIATQPRPAEPYVREEPNPKMCLACGGADHDRSMCAEHWEILDRMRAYLAKYALPKDEPNVD